MRAQERLQKTRLLKDKQNYLAGRQDEADIENQYLAEMVGELEGILATGIARNPAVSFRSLYRQMDPTDLPDALKTLTAPRKSDFVPRPLGIFANLMPSSKNKQAIAISAGIAKYDKAVDEFEQLKGQRAAVLKSLEAAVNAHNQEIDALKSELEAGEPQAVKAYSQLVLDHSPYPDSFPQENRIGFVADSKQLVVDLRVPLMADTVPEMERFKYVKAQDAVVGTKRSDKSQQALY